MSQAEVPDAAALYDWECRHVLHRGDQDVGFWLELAGRTGGPVLELACGTGRLAVALAAAGVHVVGLDRDPVMLAAAVRGRLRRSLSAHPGGHPMEWPIFVAADMRRFAFGGRFRLVFVGYNSLQLLSPDDMTTCLRMARKHVAAGGLVGVEVTDFQCGGADSPDDPPDGGSPVALADAEGIRLSGTLVHDLAVRTSSYRRHFAGDGWAIQDEVVVRSLDRAELAALFTHAGLTPVTWWAAGTTVRATATPEA